MSTYAIDRMTEIFRRCLHEAVIFKREVPSKSLFETTVVPDKGGVLWALFAAGISEEEAEHFFKTGSSQALQATEPLTILGEGRGSVKLLIRPIEWPQPNPPPLPTKFIAHYAPGDGIPFVEISQGQICLDFPSNDLVLTNVRWEVDSREACKPPFEDWLKKWSHSLKQNPAHSSSHLHFNSQPKPSAGRRSRGEEALAANELRLALGDANPLAFILSVSAWLRRNATIH